MGLLSVAGEEGFEMNVRPAALLTGHVAPVWSIAWHPKGHLLASASSDRSVRLWAQEGEEWICKSTLDGEHSGTVRTVAFSPCGRYLASGSFDSQTIVYKRNEFDFEVVASLQSHDKEIKCVSWSPSGQFLATCGRDKTVCLYEMDEDGDFQCVGASEGVQRDLKHLRWHPKESMLATACYDNSIAFHVHDEEEDEWIVQEQFVAHDSTTWCLAFDSTGNRFCTSSSDKTVKIWQRSDPSSSKSPEVSWSCVGRITEHHSRPIYWVDWSDQSGLIVTASGDNAIRIFKEKDEHSFLLLDEVKDAHSMDVNCAAWNPVKSMIASCSDDCTVKLWSFN